MEITALLGRSFVLSLKLYKLCFYEHGSVLLSLCLMDVRVSTLLTTEMTP